MKATSTMETYAANVSTQTKISPAIIAAIIAMIGQLIGSCPKPPTPADVLTGGGVWGHIILNKAIRRASDIQPWSADGQKLIAVMQAEASHLSEGDAATFLAISQAS